MRYILPVAILLALAGCASWDWRANGQALLQSLCLSADSCSGTCSSTEAGTGKC